MANTESDKPEETDKKWKPAFPGGAGNGEGDSEQNGDLRVEDTGTYEMLWDCKYCGTKKLLGVTHKFCASCGAKQDPNARYFPSDEEKIALKDHVYSGADKVCGNCSAVNGAKAGFCTQCGSPLDNAKEATGRERQESESAFGAETVQDAKKEVQARKDGTLNQPVAETPSPGFFSSKWGKILLIGGGSLIALLIFAFFKTSSVDVILQDHSWVREIKVEKYTWQNMSEWCDSVPFDARIISRTRAVRSTDKVKDGETCKNVRIDQKDGSFKTKRECRPKYKDVPVYADKCSYQVLRWGYFRSATATGALKDEPVWPNPNIRDAGTTIGSEREGGRSESYIVKLHSEKKNKTYDCAYDIQKWKSLSKGSKYKLNVNMLGSAKCDTLQ